VPFACTECGEEAIYVCDFCGDYRCPQHIGERLQAGDVAVGYADDAVGACLPRCQPIVIAPLAVAGMAAEQAMRDEAVPF
jgi:hypothetical protein